MGKNKSNNTGVNTFVRLFEPTLKTNPADV